MSPADLSDEDAAQALVNPVTAWVMTMVEHDLKPGDWLVQTAAGSTVGQLVLQLARSERFRTVNIVRRRAQAPDIKALGGEVVISSEDNDWGTQLATASTRSEEHTSELQSPCNLVCRLLLEKKNKFKMNKARNTFFVACASGSE